MKVLKEKGGNEVSSSGLKNKHEKYAGKKSKNKNCFNCGKSDHFSRDCTKPKVMFNHNSPSNIYVSSCLMLAETILFWTVDSTATNHVVRN